MLSKARSPFLNTVPTIAESKLADLQNFEVVGWTGLLAPAGTPRDFVAAMNTETTRIFAPPQDARHPRCAGPAGVPVHPPEHFAIYIRAELASWRAMARASGVEGKQ